MITKEDFKKEVTTVLKGALAGLPEATQLAKVSEVLETAETTISELLQTVESKDDELATSSEDNLTLKQQVDELMAKTKLLDEQLAAREAELKALTDLHMQAEQRAVAAETIIAEAAKIKTLETRVAELATSKVLKAGEKLEAQKAKIKSMSDEEFATYRDDLVDVRSELEALLKSATTEVATTVADIEETVEVAPAAISKETAAAGTVAVEIVKTPTQKDRYAAFGAGLVKLMGNTLAGEK